MIEPDMVKTIAEAEAQTVPIASYSDWFQYAHLLDGYAICEEWGIKGHTLFDKWQSTPESCTVLEARVLLFLEARAMRFTCGCEPYQIVDALLQHIAHHTQQVYIPLTPAEIDKIEMDARAELKGFIVKPKKDTS